jgi:hypothetical protein
VSNPPKVAPLNIVKKNYEDTLTRSRTPEPKTKAPLSPFAPNSFSFPISRSNSLAGFARLLTPTTPTEATKSFEIRRPRKGTPGGHYQAVDELLTLKQLLMEDTRFYQLVLQFAKAQQCSETILFFAEFWQYKNTTDHKLRVEQFKTLYKKFIQQGCLCELNLPGYVRDLVNSFLSYGEGEMPSDVDDLLEDSLIPSLQDIYRRFEESRLYNQIKIA